MHKTLSSMLCEIVSDFPNIIECTSGQKLHVQRNELVDHQLQHMPFSCHFRLGQWRVTKLNANILWDSWICWEIYSISVSYGNLSRYSGIIQGEGQVQPSTDPWGTPVERWWNLYPYPCQETLNESPLMYDSNQLRAFPQILSLDSIERRWSWCTVKKRLLTSLVIVYIIMTMTTMLW